MTVRVSQFFFLAVLAEAVLVAQPNRSYTIDTVAGITLPSVGTPAVSAAIDNI